MDSGRPTSRLDYGALRHGPLGDESWIISTLKKRILYKIQRVFRGLPEKYSFLESLN